MHKLYSFFIFKDQQIVFKSLAYYNVLYCHFRFAKNLSHDQIHLSALKGEGELKNLELNEEVLTELLELPSWLRLSGATCNRVAVRIQWTKLKSVPIHLSLDEVNRFVTLGSAKLFGYVLVLVR